MKIQWLATPILHRKYISTETSLFMINISIIKANKPHTYMIFCKTLA